MSDASPDVVRGERPLAPNIEYRGTGEPAHTPFDKLRADGSNLDMDITTADIEFMGETTTGASSTANPTSNPCWA